MAPAFKLLLGCYKPKMPHADFPASSWLLGGRTPPRKCSSLPETGMPPALGRESSRSHTQLHLFSGSTKPFPCFLSDQHLGKPCCMATDTLGSGFSTGEDGRIAPAQEVILNLVGKNWEDHEAPTSQYRALPCSRHKQLEKIKKNKDQEEKNPEVFASKETEF